MVGPKQTIKLDEEYTVYDQGGMSKVHRITQNERAIALLLKEVQQLKQEVDTLKKSLTAKKASGQWNFILKHHIIVLYLL